MDHTTITSAAAVALALSLVAGCAMTVSQPLQSTTAHRVEKSHLGSRLAFADYRAETRLGADTPVRTAGQDYGPYDLRGFTNYFTFRLTAPDGPYLASCATEQREHDADTPIVGLRVYENFKMLCMFGPDGAPPAWKLEFDASGGMFSESRHQGALIHGDRRYALDIPGYFGKAMQGVEIVGADGSIGAVQFEPDLLRKPRVWFAPALPPELSSAVATTAVAFILGVETRNHRMHDEGED
jgi:hypothetical protein